MSSLIGQQDPQRGYAGGLCPLRHGGQGHGLVALRISVQPLADIVGDYACHDRDHEGYEIPYRTSPPFCAGIGGGNGIII